MLKKSCSNPKSSALITRVGDAEQDCEIRKTREKCFLFHYHVEDA